MPIVLREKGYRFGFFASDMDEPPHVHVDKNGRAAKFWLTPMVRLEWTRGLRPHELNEAERIIESHRDELIEAWHDFFAC
jgi:hypothetical protein